MQDNQTRIRVTFYFASGREQGSHDCDSIPEAFERLQRTNMDAIAHWVGTPSGGYHWRANQPGHTLEGFTAVLERAQ